MTFMLISVNQSPVVIESCAFGNQVIFRDWRSRNKEKSLHLSTLVLITYLNIMLLQSVSRLASKNGRGVANRLNRPSSAMWSTTPRMACQISARGTIHRAIRSVCTPPSKIPIFSFSRSMATQVSQNPFLDWHLFPDFQHLLTQCKPATAVPIFEKFLNNAEERFKQLEKSFTPTWEGSIGLSEYSR